MEIEAPTRDGIRPSCSWLGAKGLRKTMSPDDYMKEMANSEKLPAALKGNIFRDLPAL